MVLRKWINCQTAHQRRGRAWHNGRNLSLSVLCASGLCGQILTWDIHVQNSQWTFSHDHMWRSSYMSISVNVAQTVWRIHIKALHDSLCYCSFNWHAWCCAFIFILPWWLCVCAQILFYLVLFLKCIYDLSTHCLILDTLWHFNRYILVKWKLVRSLPCAENVRDSDVSLSY